MNIADEIKSIKGEKTDLKKFGFLIGGILIVLGAFFLWRERGSWSYFVLIGSALVFLGAAAPALLRPIYKAWMTLGIFLGMVVTNLILAAVFLFVLTPLHFIMKFLGKKFLDMDFISGGSSYWLRRENIKIEKTDLERQY